VRAQPGVVSVGVDVGKMGGVRWLIKNMGRGFGDAAGEEDSRIACCHAERSGNSFSSSAPRTGFEATAESSLRSAWQSDSKTLR
jgi:hypothetical protein